MLFYYIYVGHETAIETSLLSEMTLNFLAKFQKYLEQNNVFMYFQAGFYTKIWIDIICGYI